MTAPTHVNREVHSVENVDFGSDEQEMIHLVNRTLLHSSACRAIVMPSEGKIMIFRTTYSYAEDVKNMPQALASALQHLGFFTDQAPPSQVPAEIVTPVDGEHPHYLVEVTIYPQRHTVHSLMRG